MKQTMLLKLAPSPEQSNALLETVHAFNDACNAIAEVAYAEQLANKFELQKLALHPARLRLLIRAARSSYRTTNHTSACFSRTWPARLSYR